MDKKADFKAGIKPQIEELENMIKALLEGNWDSFPELSRRQEENHRECREDQESREDRESREDQNCRKDRITVAIDGMSCAGKSTVAAFLAEKFGGQVIHMDDFFLPVELRSEERLAEPGGNVHYERFAEEVLPFLGTKSEFSYGKFCCGKMDIIDKIKIADRDFLVVEGAYALRPEFQPYYDIKVCMTISPRLQKERLSEREGKERAEVFLNRWIPMENKYLENFQIIEASDVLIEVLE